MARLTRKQKDQEWAEFERLRDEATQARSRFNPASFPKLNTEDLAAYIEVRKAGERIKDWLYRTKLPPVELAARLRPHLHFIEDKVEEERIENIFFLCYSAQGVVKNLDGRVITPEVVAAIMKRRAKTLDLLRVLRALEGEPNAAATLASKDPPGTGPQPLAVDPGFTMADLKKSVDKIRAVLGLRGKSALDVELEREALRGIRPSSADEVVKGDQAAAKMVVEISRSIERTVRIGSKWKKTNGKKAKIVPAIELTLPELSAFIRREILNYRPWQRRSAGKEKSVANPMSRAAIRRGVSDFAHQDGERDPAKRAALAMIREILREYRAQGRLGQAAVERFLAEVALPVGRPSRPRKRPGHTKSIPALARKHCVSSRALRRKSEALRADLRAICPQI